MKDSGWGKRKTGEGGGRGRGEECCGARRQELGGGGRGWEGRRTGVISKHSPISGYEATA